MQRCTLLFGNCLNDDLLFGEVIVSHKGVSVNSKYLVKSYSVVINLLNGHIFDLKMITLRIG